MTIATNFPHLFQRSVPTSSNPVLSHSFMFIGRVLTVLFYFLTYVKLHRKFNYCVPHLTADICKTKGVRVLEIILMERSVNFT